jgi:hypothetical protein
MRQAIKRRPNRRAGAFERAVQDTNAPSLGTIIQSGEDSFKLKSVMADRLMTKGQAPVRHEGARLLPDPVHGISTAIEAREAPAFNKAAR